MIKLYRFDYSPFVRKAQMVLDLIGAEYEAVDVPYGDRTQLVELTGGYVQVPVPGKVSKAMVPWMEKLEQWRRPEAV